MSPNAFVIRISGYVAMTCAVLILAFTLFEILMRSLGSPTTWVLDTSSYLLCVMVGAAFPLITASNGNVAITLLTDMLREPTRRRSYQVVDLICALVCFIAAYLFLTVVLSQFDQGITTLSGVVIPKWLLTAAIFYGLGASGIVHGFNGVFGRTSTKKPEEVL